MDELTFQDSIAALKHPDYSVRCKSALALGKSKDKRAVEPLIAAMTDANEFVRMDVACALGQIGDTHAVEPLIHALHDAHGYVRREAALALGELGDIRAVDRLIVMLEGDQASAAAAKALFKITGEAYERILMSGRSPEIVYKEAIERKLGGEKTVNNQGGNDYIDSCFHFEFQELDDDRNALQIPEAKDIIDAGNMGRTNEAIQLAEAFKKKCPDYSFSYYWLGSLYLRQKRYDDAQNVVLEGINLAKSKSDLCNQMAEISLEIGDISEANKWWIRCTLLEIKKNNFGVVNFVYLSEIADALGLFNASRKLQSYADETGLESNAVRDLHNLTRLKGTESMKKAINILVSEYLRPSPELVTLAKEGIYCDLCKTRFTIDELSKPSIVENKYILFKCPKCKVVRTHPAE